MAVALSIYYMLSVHILTHLLFTTTLYDGHCCTLDFQLQTLRCLCYELAQYHTNIELTGRDLLREVWLQAHAHNH